VRIDRGTANLADPIQTLIQRTTTALSGAGLSPRGIAVHSLYGGDLIWGATDARTAPLTTIAAALRGRAALDNAAPAGCATAALLDVGRRLSYIGASAPFAVRPGALMVGFVDHGTRPASLASCGHPLQLATETACWASFSGTVLHRAQFRFGFFATPETGTTATMKASCLAVQGFPVETLDALEPSSVTCYDPLAAWLDQSQPDLATRFDLCRAFGSDAPAQLGAFANAWSQLLIGQP
jgi:hypothetical protein